VCQIMVIPLLIQAPVEGAAILPLEPASRGSIMYTNMTSSGKRPFLGVGGIS